jgi:hypothetical protein
MYLNRILIITSALGQSNLLAEGKSGLLHLLEAKNCCVKYLRLTFNCSHLNQPFFLGLVTSRIFSLYLHLFLIVTVSLILALIMIIVAGQLEDPLWVNLTARVDVISRTLYNLMIDYPLGVNHTENRGRVHLQFLLRPNIQIAAISLYLSYIRKVTRKYTPQYSLVLIC